MDTRISGTTQLLGLIGNPVRHSGSPRMYNFCFDYYGMDCVYLAFESSEEETEATLQAMRRLHMAGGNVTMPCKRAAARLVDELSPEARLIGAVNTIVNREGILTGYNTDGKGLILDLMDHGVSIREKKIVLLGAGGAASSIMVQCALDGASAVTVYNRSLKPLESLQEIGRRLLQEGSSCRMEFQLIGDGRQMHERILEADILINATSVGMAPKSEGISLVTDKRVFRPKLVVYDVIYHPEVTRLMSDALEYGCRKEAVIGGKGMLLWQGYRAFGLFTGKEMPVKEWKRFLEKEGR